MTFHSFPLAPSLHLKPTPSIFLLSNNLQNLLSPPFFSFPFLLKPIHKKTKTLVACHWRSLSQHAKRMASSLHTLDSHPAPLQRRLHHALHLTDPLPSLLPHPLILHLPPRQI